MHNINIFHIWDSRKSRSVSYIVPHTLMLIHRIRLLTMYLPLPYLGVKSTYKPPPLTILDWYTGGSTSTRLITWESKLEDYFGGNY